MMMIMGWDDMQTHHSGPSELGVRGAMLPHPQILAGIEAKSSSKGLLLLLDSPPHGFSNLPTALNSESWPSIYVPTNHTRGVRAKFLLFFHSGKLTFLPKYFLFLISGHFIILFKKGGRIEYLLIN